MTTDNDELEMTFDPSTIEHLGIQMYSTLPPVIAELIANAYDADATEVMVELIDDADEKQIIISDDGYGMSFAEINSSFLRIGRNRRKDSSDETPLGRKVIGKKGLGKLSFFGMSDIVEIQTIQSSKLNSFEMNLNDILQSQSKTYHPRVIIRDKLTTEPDGTKIILKNVRRKTKFCARDLAISLAKYFFIDGRFKIYVTRGNEKIEVSEQLRLEGIDKQFDWSIPDDIPSDENKFFIEKDILGQIITAQRPLSPEMRGITLYSRGKLVNTPSSFVEGDSSHFYSYMTGFIDVSYLDLLDEDYVSTNRQSLKWEEEETQELKSRLSRLVRHFERVWRKERRREKEESAKANTGVDIEKWLSSNAGDSGDDLKDLVDLILASTATESKTAHGMIKKVHELVPEYASYYWRHLHPEVQRISKTYYENRNYYTAVLECVKRYISEVRRLSDSSSEEEELNMLQRVFSKKNPVLKIALDYVKANGEAFSDKTLGNIEEGNRGFAAAVWQGVRNPISHEEVVELSSSGLFTERDCLDALSILSHLFRRLENAKRVGDKGNKTPVD